MTELHKVLVAMAEATAKYKEEDAKIMEEHGKKFGIDISETFSYKYEKEAGEPVKEVERKSSKESDSVNDLMD